MKRIILFTVCCMCFLMCFFSSHAQITTNEIPFGLKNSSMLISLKKIVLPVRDIDVVLKEDMDAAQLDGPTPFAYPIKVSFTPENAGVWSQLDDGSKLWRLNVHAPGALATSTYYDQFWLPKGAKFSIYNDKTSQFIGAITSEFIEGSREKPLGFASALIYGENIIYEYYQPASVYESPVISISFINFAYQNVKNPYNVVDLRSGFGTSCDIQVNINCFEGNDWQAEKHAVARIIIPMGDRSYLCSGALVNNTNNDYTPYLLTADHCLCNNSVRYYDAEGNSNATGMIFYWEYEHTGCANSLTEPIHRTTQGAKIIANIDAYTSDFALLKLTQDPRYVNGVTPYYLGWDKSGVSGTGGVGIHHPMGDVKKIATHNQTPQSIVNSWVLYWMKTPNGYSITEGGSSGSPLINNNRHLIGQLYGSLGQGNCNNPANMDAIYRKFSVSWTGGGTSNNQRKLDYWLAPGLVGANQPSTLNGTFAIIGSATICQSGTFSVTNLPSGFSWGASPNISISGSGTQVTATGISAGSGYIIIKNSSNVEIARKIVTVEPTLYFSSITGPFVNSPRRDSTFLTFYANFAGSPSSINWTIIGIPTGQYSIRNFGNAIEIGVNQPWNFQLHVAGCCGCNGSSSGYINVNMSKSIQQPNEEEEFLSTYPNPVSGVLNINIQNSAQGILVNPNYDINLYDSFGTLKLQTTSQSINFQINVSNLSNGIYFLHVYNNSIGKLMTQKIIVIH